MKSKATATKTQREIRSFEDTITLEISIEQARILRTILGKNNGSTTSDIYQALHSLLGPKDDMEEILDGRLPSLDLWGILGK